MNVLLSYAVAAAATSALFAMSAAYLKERTRRRESLAHLRGVEIAIDEVRRALEQSRAELAELAQVNRDLIAQYAGPFPLSRTSDVRLRSELATKQLPEIVRKPPSL